MNYCLGENQIEIPKYYRLPKLLQVNSISHLFKVLNSCLRIFVPLSAHLMKLNVLKPFHYGLAYHVLLFCKNRTVGNLVIFISMYQDKALKNSFQFLE